MPNAHVLSCCQSTSIFDGVQPCALQASSHQMKQPLGIGILSWFAALASAGMFVSIALAILDIGPHLMGGEKVTRSEWLHIRRSARRGDRLPDGFDRVRSCRA